MKWLIKTALRLRVVITVASIVLMVFGLRTIGDSPLDVFPEFAPPRVEIQTEGPGMSTAEVESLITMPVESAVNGILGLRTVRSKSVLGLSSVVLYFDWGADLLQARQLVQERLAALTGQLPFVARAPVILAPRSSTSRVLKIGLSSKKLAQVELTTLARWTIRPRSIAISGVANVAIWGQRDRQLQVLVDPQRLRDHGVLLDDVLRATGQAVVPQAGGFIETPVQRLAVTHVPSIRTAEDLQKIPVAVRNGIPLQLQDVANVVEGFPPPVGDAVINDGPGLLLIVEKQPSGNTLDVTRRVEAAMELLRPALSDVDVDTTIFRPATFIEMSVGNLQKALLLGCFLVIAVLVIFLYEWRTALISLVAIPVSLITVLLIIYYRGETINTMVLAGLVIALGSLVDDAIIDVENITRRLRLNRDLGSPRSPFRVVFDASMEVRSAVVFASLIVALVFLPVYFLEGLSGAFFQPLATSYILAILASLGVALTLTPALALILLPNAVTRADDGRFIQALRRGYRRFLPTVLNHSWLAVTLLILLSVVTLMVLPFLGEEFLPDFQVYDFLMHWVEKPGTSIEAMRRVTIRASRELRAIPGVRNFGAHIPLSDVADIRIAPTPNVITHENGSRKLDVSCNVRGVDLGTVARSIETRVLEIDFPRGYHPEFLGEYAARQESRNRLFAFGALSLLGIFLILYSDFQSMRVSLLIFLSLPFALIGGVMAAVPSGGVLSLGSLLGFVTVIGIAARNGILLVSHYRHLEREEHVEFGTDLVIRGAEERLSPILMTAATTTLALLPIALGGNKPGHEIEHPMAIIIIGGSVTSTVLNLVLMPVLYRLLGGSRTSSHREH